MIPIACADDDRFVHEPRALWTMQQLQAAASAGTLNTARVVVPKDHFRNVGKYPITLTKMVLSGVNYAFREFAPPAGDVNAAMVHNCATMLDHIRVRISAPYSRHFSKYRNLLPLMAPKPCSEPGMMYSPNPGASGLFGLTRWTFDRPYRLPRKATIQLDLSGWNVPNLGLSIDGAVAFSSVAVDEPTTGRMYGNSRIRDRAQIPQLRSQSVGGTFWPQVTDIFPPDNFQSLVGTENNTWPAAQAFTGPDFNRQETDRGQEYTYFSGFAVHIDQITWDDFVAPNLLAGQRLAPLAMAMGIQARTTNGGTGQWWWRRGAPIALVCPTITPAQVYAFEQPITLGPGDQLEVELEAPVGPSLQLNGSGGAQQVRPIYNIGLSMTGYATIQ